MTAAPTEKTEIKLPLRRRRQCGPKVRTGCVTCKIRRVKCDEGRPFCQRCAKTGRTCDGYEQDPQKSGPSRAASTALISSISLMVPGDFEERKLFNYFITKTAPDLCGYYASGFWDNLLLQVSMEEPALRHAVVALGGMHLEFDGKRKRLALPEHTSLSVAKSGVAIDQYGKAIGHLRRSLASGSLSPLKALMTCILFVCFDSLRGEFTSAMMHLNSGLKVLRDLSSKSKSEEETIQSAIIPIFVRLIIQSVLYIDSRKPEERKGYSRELMELEKRAGVISMTWKTLEDARLSLNRATDGLFVSFYSFEGELAMGEQAAAAYNLFLRNCKELEEWNRSFETFMNRNSAKLDSRSLRGAALLKIHHLTISVMAAAVPGLNDPRSPAVAACLIEEYDRFTDSFLIIINLSRSLLIAMEEDEKMGKPSLAFWVDMGLIAPLYFVCIKSTKEPVRKAAMDLLLRCPRKEGMWDSRATVKLVRELWVVMEKHKQLNETYGITSAEKLSFYDAVNLDLKDGMEWEWKWKWHGFSPEGSVSASTPADAAADAATPMSFASSSMSEESEYRFIFEGEPSLSDFGFGNLGPKDFEELADLL